MSLRRRGNREDWEYLPASGRAKIIAWRDLPLARVAIIGAILLAAYFLFADSFSFDKASLGTGDACQDVLLKDDDDAIHRNSKRGACQPTATPASDDPNGTPVLPILDAHPCDTPGYHAQLYSPPVPGSSDVYTYVVDGCKPSDEEEIDYVKFSGCWNIDQIKDVQTSAGTVELIAPDFVRISGISDDDLPLSVNIVFFVPLDSGENRTWIWVHAGPSIGDGFTYVVGGPFCDNNVTKTPSPTPTEPVTNTPSPTPTKPVTNTPSPTPTEPATDTPSPTPTEPPTPTATAPTEPPTDTPSPTPTEPPTDTPSPPPTEPPTNTPSPTATPAPPKTDLTIIKNDQPDPVTIGGTLAYTVTVSNIGDMAAENVIVTDALPANVTFISATPSQGSCDGTTCNLGTIDQGEGAVISYVVRVEEGAVSPLTNVACVASSTHETDLTNNCDEEETKIPETPTPTALEITSTPNGLPNTGGLPDADGSTGSRLLITLGIALLLVGGVATMASRRRGETEA